MQYDTLKAMVKLQELRRAKDDKELDRIFEDFLEDLNLNHDLGICSDNDFYLCWYWSLHVRDDMKERLKPYAL